MAITGILLTASHYQVRPSNVFRTLPFRLETRWHFFIYSWNAGSKGYHFKFVHFNSTVPPCRHVRSFYRWWIRRYKVLHRTAPLDIEAVRPTEVLSRWQVLTSFLGLGDSSFSGDCGHVKNGLQALQNFPQTEEIFFEIWTMLNLGISWLLGSRTWYITPGFLARIPFQLTVLTGGKSPKVPLVAISISFGLLSFSRGWWQTSFRICVVFPKMTHETHDSRHLNKGRMKTFWTSKVSSSR